MNSKDLVVKTGSYTDRDGNEKSRYENIGKMIEGKDGPYLLIKRTFNPAGVPGGDGRDMITVSIYEQREQQGQQRAASSAPPRSGAAAAGTDDIPF